MNPIFAAKVQSLASPRVIAALATIVVANALLIASAKIQVPFWPVPMTLQTLAAVLIGMTAGSRLGAIAVAAYLLEGAFGFPVFAGTPERGIGLAYMAGPTGGYLVGFFVAAALVGFLAERGFGRTWFGRVAVIASGFIAIYACGLAWLASLIGMSHAIDAGLMPFLLGDAVKLLLGAGLLEAIARLRVCG